MYEELENAPTAQFIHRASDALGGVQSHISRLPPKSNLEPVIFIPLKTATVSRCKYVVLNVSLLLNPAPTAYHSHHLVHAQTPIWASLGGERQAGSAMRTVHTISLFSVLTNRLSTLITSSPKFCATGAPFITCVSHTTEVAADRLVGRSWVQQHRNILLVRFSFWCEKLDFNLRWRTIMS